MLIDPILSDLEHPERRKFNSIKRLMIKELYFIELFFKTILTFESLKILFSNVNLSLIKTYSIPSQY